MIKDKLFRIKILGGFLFPSLLVIGFLFSCADKKSKEKKAVVSFQQKPGKLSILVDNQPFASYIYEDSLITRPYFENVISPCGIQVTRNHPIQAGDPKDHESWHPGIWMSFADINGIDYWRLKSKIEHEMFVEQPKGGAGIGTFSVRNYYLSQDRKDRILGELVKYSVIVKPEGILLLWETTFSSPSHDFTFGDQEEMGLGVRVNTGISVQYGNGHITNTEGLKDGDEVWGKASDWLDYSGEIDDKHVGITIMPDPNNFRPSWYHARDYGYVAANPFGREAMEQGEKSAITVKQGETFHLGYGVWIYCNPEGIMPDIDKAYNDYLEVINSTL